MSSFLASFQEEKRLEQPQASPRALAKIYAYSNNKARLVFEGDSAPTEKWFRCNSSISFRAGQRVVVLPIAKSYVVAFPIS